jgi:hypothetical protein
MTAKPEPDRELAPWLADMYAEIEQNREKAHVRLGDGTLPAQERVDALHVTAAGACPHSDPRVVFSFRASEHIRVCNVAVIVELATGRQYPLDHLAEIFDSQAREFHCIGHDAKTYLSTTSTSAAPGFVELCDQLVGLAPDPPDPDWAAWVSTLMKTRQHLLDLGHNAGRHARIEDRSLSGPERLELALNDDVASCCPHLMKCSHGSYTWSVHAQVCVTPLIAELAAAREVPLGELADAFDRLASNWHCFRVVGQDAFSTEDTDRPSFPDLCDQLQDLASEMEEPDRAHWVAALAETRDQLATTTYGYWRGYPPR